MTDWDPEQYRRFAEQRAQPFWDLAELVDAARVEHAVDLGCGSGELTTELAARYEVASMLGIDGSPAMLDAARLQPGTPGQGTSVRFEAGDIAEWTAAAQYDLVFSNAALQWVPDHRAVLARWSRALRPAGQLAVQVPCNADMPAHLVAAEVAASEPFRSAFGDGGPPPDPVAANVLAPEAYAELLHELGFVEQHVRLHVYPHVLPGSHHVVEWVRGTMLTRFQKRLDPVVFDEFVAAYEQRLLAEIGDAEPFFFPFKRILIWGRLAD